MRASALLNLPVTRPGMDCPAHAGLMSAAPKVQRAVVQGSVVVVVLVVVSENTPPPNVPA
jgi:hypothetical protein